MCANDDPAGDPASSQSARELFPKVYDELRRLASRALSRSPQQSFQTTSLLHDAWLRLERVDAGWRNHDHFLAVAATAMRSVLVDHSRRRMAEKRRAKGSRLDLDHVVDAMEARSRDLVALDEALTRLGAFDEELARVVELRFFAGLKHPAISRIMGIPLRRVERGWATARAWLHQQLEEPDEDST